MKGLLLFPLLLLLVGVGQKQTPNVDDSNSMLVFFCDKTSYSNTDTINLTIRNDSDSDLVIRLRGPYIEMGCQQEENGTWSKNIKLPYMNLRCVTKLYTIPPNNTFRHSFPANYFDEKGRYRFLLEAINSKNNSKIIVSTNSFTIE